MNVGLQGFNTVKRLKYTVHSWTAGHEHKFPAPELASETWYSPNNEFIQVALMMEAVSTSETSVISSRLHRRQLPSYSRCDNPISRLLILFAIRKGCHSNGRNLLLYIII
jgi:hypothetical protein